MSIFGLDTAKERESGRQLASRRHRLGFLLGLVCAGIAATPAKSEEPIRIAPETVVSASRVAIPAEQAGSTVTIIDSEDLEHRQIRLVSDVLRDVPGLAVNRAGAVGNTTQVRIRGAEANQTVVLIDGIEVGDPTNSEFNFAHLLAADIERIEVIRGPQSALWGADAIGGVINIITKRGQRDTEVSASVEGGSFATRQGNASLSGGVDNWNGAVSLTYFETGGTNVARSGSEDESAENFTVFANGSIDLLDNLTLDLSGRLVDTENQFDPQDFTFPFTPTNGLVIDGDDAQETEQVFGKANLTLSLLDDRWEHRVGAAYTEVEKEFTTSGVRTSRNEGQRTKFDYQSNLRLETAEFADAGHTLIFLAEREEEDFENEGATPSAPENQNQERHSTAFVGEYRLDLWDSLFLSGAVRHDINSDFDDATTYRVAGAYVLPWTGTRLHASYSTGVTNPTFFEQFGFFPGSFVGNPNIKPEESQGWDVGVEHPFLGGDLVLDVTYFQTNLEDEIITTFDPMTFLLGVDNLDGESEREGIEVSLRAEPLEGLSVDAGYTFTQSTDATGRTEVRRPKHIAHLNLNQRFLDDRANIGLSVRYTGKQSDAEFVSLTPQDRVDLDAFTLVNLTGSYQITDHIQAFARLENLLDENYEEVFSFVSPGIAGYAGVRIKFGP